MVAQDTGKSMKDSTNYRPKQNQERIENLTSILTILDVAGEKVKTLPQADLTKELGLSLTETHSTILITVFLLGIIANMVVLVLFYRKPSLRTFSNRFVVNLSVIHLLQSVLVTPYIIVSTFYQRWVFGSIWCQISGALSVTLNMATVLSLLLIAVDRNCAVNSPLHYSMTITKRRTGALIIGVWVLALISTLPPLFGTARLDYRKEWNLCGVVWIQNDLCCIVYSTYLCITGFVLPFLKMTWIYCSMFMAAKTNSARARQHSVNSTTEPDSSDTTERGGGGNGCAAKRRTYRRSSTCGSQNFIFGQEWKAARTGIIILTSFFVSWFPYFATILTEPLLPAEQMPPYVPPVVVLLTLSSSIVDPYIYVFRTKAVRRHISKFFKRFSRRVCLCSGKIESNGKDTLRPVCRGSFPPRQTFGEFDCSTTRTHLWQTVLAHSDKGQVLENRLILAQSNAVQNETSDTLNHDNLTQTLETNILQGQNVTLSEEEVLSLHSRNGFYALKMRRVRGLSNESSDTGQNSPQSSLSLEEIRGSDDQDAPNSPPLKRKTPFLKRGDSLVQYKEVREVPNVLSKFGVFRRRSYIVRRVDRSEDSSDANMTSSTSTESQGPTRPRLVRQRSVTLSCCEESAYS